MQRSARADRLMEEMQSSVMRDAMLRQKKDELLVPLARQFFFRIHPNWVSLIAMVVGLASAAAVLGQQYWLGLGLWLLNRVLDGLDGLVARVHNKQSDFGGFLDLMFDFVVYLAVPIAFVAALPSDLNRWALVWLLAIYVLNLLSWTTLAALVEKRSLERTDRLTSIEMPVGLIEGAETILFYVLFFLLPIFVGYLFIIMGALVLFTAGQRVRWAYLHLR